MVWRSKVSAKKNNQKKKIKITKSLLFVTFDGFGFKNDVRLSKCFNCDK